MIDDNLLIKLWGEYKNISIHKFADAYFYALQEQPATVNFDAKETRALKFLCYVAGYLTGKEELNDLHTAE